MLFSLCFKRAIWALRGSSSAALFANCSFSLFLNEKKMSFSNSFSSFKKRFDWKTHDFLDVLLQRDDLVLEAFVQLALMFDCARLDLHRLEYLAGFTASRMCLQQHNASHHLSVSTSSEPAAHMRLNARGHSVLHEDALAIALQITSTQGLRESKSRLVKNQDCLKIYKVGYKSGYLELDDKLSRVEELFASHIALPRLLYFDGSTSLSFDFEQTASQKTATSLLHEQHGPLNPQVLGTSQPATYVLLDHDAAHFELFWAQFFQVGHLARLEEYLRLAELVLHLVLEKCGLFKKRSLPNELRMTYFDQREQDVLARLFHHLAVDLLGRDEHAIAMKKLLISPARRIARCTYAHCFQDTTSSQLLDGSFRIESFIKKKGKIYKWTRNEFVMHFSYLKGALSSLGLMHRT